MADGSLTRKQVWGLLSLPYRFWFGGANSLGDTMEVDLITGGAAEEDAIEFDDYSNNNTPNLEGERCGICMDVIIDRGVLDCCQHWFCFVCIDNWATITNLCPLCQNEFQLITCVPVYDTIGSSKADDDSYTRDDDWCIEGKNNTLSFPSYYIDENAVICLDGDGCKIRNGSASSEGDSDLDTSIACDSCDIWYHAFCVGFDTEGTSENTWLCPRCVVDEMPQKPDGNVSGPENVNRDCSAEDTYSRKVSISVADTGETAVVVSMVGGSKLTGEPSERILSTLPVDEEVKTKTYVLTSEGNNQTVATPSRESSITQPVLEAQELELSLSCDSSFSFPSNCLTHWEIKTSADETMDEHRRFGDIKNSLGNLSNESHNNNNLSEINSNVGLHLGLSVGSFLSADDKNKSGTEIQMNEDVKQHKPSEEYTSKSDKNVPDADDNASGVIGVKRKHSDCRDNIHVSADDGDSKPKTETEVSTKKRRAEKKIEVIPSKDETIVTVSDDSQNCSLIAAPSNGRLRCDPKRENATPDIMSIVQETNRRHSKRVKCPNSDDKSSKDQETMGGLRVKKIMKRAAEDKESSMVKKSMLQKGKVRENLTKKIYGLSNGRRKRAWDRDCEIEFWKHRCMGASKPEKIQTLKSVLDLLRNESEGTETEQSSERQSTNPILSRLYLADTSVFPRKDDIKPLSAIKTSSDSELNTRKPTLAEKCLNSSLENHTSCSSQTNKVSSKVGIPSSETSGKRKTIPGLKDNAASSKVHLNKNAGSFKTNAQKETAIKPNDIKSDKRKWALEVLARKTTGPGNASNEKQEDVAMIKGNYPLLAQLPIDMRPGLAPSRHNKIPVSVRQTQLYRLTEHFLRKANLEVICRTAETELAIADAVNIEKEVADRSNSKLVYLNLCSQETLHRSEKSKSLGVPEMDSSSLSAVPVDRSEQSTIEVSAEEALRRAGLSSDSPPNNYNPDLDIYGDFDYNLEDEDYIGATSIKVSKEQQEGVSKVKMVFSTLHPERPNNALDSGKTENLENAEISNTSSCMLKNCTDEEIKNLTMEDSTDNTCVPLESLHCEEGEDPSDAECEELYGPDKEPLIKKFPGASSELFGLIDAKAVTETKDTEDGGNYVQSQATTVSESGNESDTERFATGGESSSNHPGMGESAPRKEKKSNAEAKMQSDSVNSISKKVEAYIKEHIRPLCKSGVITAEQYRWAVAKTNEKVMKYHYKAKNANFLIKEGEKVKKLAEQYVEAAKQKD
ncbi:hypothetical protein FNV43_RR09436 [Rhamnella rubrinervis]|uniref:Uncharacterized protein n=1 Tax=Rhamnella rubrinervis TaxID=2594499 RepID=A0A8K0HBB5_9ROSA|nr:hypothetical protein FNV43_RR09436 [Rhamnella rubrinervis]